MSVLTICGVSGSWIQGSVEYLKGPLDVSLYCGQEGGERRRGKGEGGEGERGKAEEEKKE